MARFPTDFERRDGVFYPHDDRSFIDYTDGGEAEEYLREVLTRVRDLSSFSPELAAAVRDWPSRYHLGVERANLLRVLGLRPGARVLELGSGCGAVTRHLGESGHPVVAVEGNPTRARLAALRCRGLRDVQIVASRLEDVAFPEPFDIVTLIGVLEYAAMYSREKGDPFVGMLSRARRSLGPDGVLILAIENRLGLKYLSGCGEDHGLPRFAGIEGYPDDRGPRTFGRIEIEEKLREAGFLDVQLLLPYPDYKVPSAVLNAERTSSEDSLRFNLVDWCRQPYEDYANEREHLFCDHLALAGFARNGRLADVANSFLFIAAASPFTADSAVARTEWIAKKINCQRRAAYRTTVTLGLRGSTSLLTKEGMQGAVPVGSPLEHRPSSGCEYVERAVSLSLVMLRALRRSSGAEAAFLDNIRVWIEHLRSRNAGGKLAGDLLDCTPDNLLLDASGALHYVDSEWHWKEDLPLDWVIFRGLVSFCHRHAPWIERVLPGCGDPRALFRRCRALWGGAADEARLAELGSMERRLQELVTYAPQAPEPTQQIPYDEIAQRIVERLMPRRVLLSGPGTEPLAEALEELGIRVLSFDSCARMTERVRKAEAWDLAICLDLPQDEAVRNGVLRKLEKLRLDLICPAPGRPVPGFRELSGADASWVAPGAVWLRPSGQLRVTLVLPTSELHGGTLVIVEHARLLAARGHLVTLASLDPTPPRWVDLPGSVRFLPVPAEPLGFEEALPDADALVATLWTTAHLVARAAVARGRKLYLVQHYESLWAGEPDDVDDTYHELPLAKLVVSSWLGEVLETTFREASTLVLNGSDFAGTRRDPPRARRTSGPLRIGMLYHEAFWKGTDDAMDAFARVRAELGEGVGLVLFGTKHPRELPAGCVEFAESPTRQELARLLDSLDLFMSPSIREGFGLPALEAMCRGVAVVLTDSGGCRDYATPETALLCEPGDRAALAANLLRACRDPELRARLAAAGWARSHEFTWERSSASMERALSAAVQQPDEVLDILYVGAGPRWFETYMDPWLLGALRSLGHSVTEFQPRPQDFRWAERFVDVDLLDEERARRFVARAGRDPHALLDLVRARRPDLLLFNKALLFPASVLNELRKLRVPTAAWMVDEPQEMHFSANRGRLFDYVFLQDRASLRHHRKSGNAASFFMPHGADPAEHHPARPGEISEKSERSDVLLVGTGFPSRRALVRRLATIGCDVLVVGRHWGELGLPNVRLVNRPVSAQTAARLYRGAAITLNLHRGKDDWPTGEIPQPESPNGSFFHIAACGSLQLVDRAYPGAGEFLVRGRQYETFSSEGELVEKIGHYLGCRAEREAIAADASTAVLAHQTYAHRLRDALAQIGHPLSHHRIFGVGKSARAEDEVFDLRAAVPLLSVALSSNGNLERLQRCLLGLASGPAEPYELHVLHPPAERLAAWLDERGISHSEVEAARGLAGAVNEGLERTAGEIVLFLTDDGLATTHLGRRLAARLEAEPRLALVGPLVHPSSGPQSLSLSYRTLEELRATARTLHLEAPEHLEYLVPGQSLDPICFALRRSALDVVGRLDERYPARTLEMEDLVARLGQAGWRVGWTKGALLHVLEPPAVPTAEQRRQARELQSAKRELGQEQEEALVSAGRSALPSGPPGSRRW